MPTDHRTLLAKIKRFDQLIAYLRDEMGWPIARDSFEDVDDLFYDFTAEELGIDPRTAAKIESIKRLRPLSPRQPWGIFFVKFEPKKLPVVALRRILGQVALKKRASANSAERTAWAKDDLLFVSNYGEGDERQISFAHFSTPSDGHDLPTLKVLGWDNRDTALRLDAIARELTEHLAWPENDGDASAWRERWRAAFTLRHREVVTTSRELSIRLAALARDIRDRIKTALAIETERGPLTKLMKAFQTALVHDLDATGFADMYAQTIAYGLLSARIADPHKKTADDFASHMRTNPFLRELMETFLHVGGRRGRAGGPGIDFDELGVSEVVELLDAANMEAVVLDFGDRNPQEDPVIHFYELFLKEYDAQKRMQRGVFYTPRPVVCYIVRSVDELLRTEFGLAEGLADTTSWGEMVNRHKDLVIPEGVSPEQTFVQILDPAAGTGTFLVEAIDLIHSTMTTKWKAQGHGEKTIAVLWNEYVPKYLLPRLHGYELLMAPYAIAHLKVGLKLYETGYRFGSDERARIFLTNALEPASSLAAAHAAGLFEALGHEAQAVNEIKRTKRFSVVIGNPPYSHMTANPGEKLRGLVDIYRELDGQPIRERGAIMFERTLQDDYIKFHAFADRVTSGHPAIRAYISNSAYLDNPTLRGMRCHLTHGWSAAWLLDLHGDIKRSGEGDENVFEIRTGVAIAIFLRRLRPGAKSRAVFAELAGSRAAKYRFLGTRSIHTTDWVALTPRTPYYLFRPQSGEVISELEHAPLIHDVFVLKSEAIKTNRDHFVIGDRDEEVLSRIRVFIDPSRTTAMVKKELALSDNAQWSVDVARRECRSTFSASRLASIAYRPFDDRRIYYHPSVVFNPRPVLSDNVLSRKNTVFLTCRRIRTDVHAHFFVTDRIAVKEMLSSADNCNSYPLYRFERTFSNEERFTNFTPEFLRNLAACLRLKQSGIHGLPAGLTSEDILHYTYAVFHSPRYRARYAELLKIDFPRLPLPGGLDLFRDLARLGGELVALHLMESPKLNRPITKYTGPKNPEVRRVDWADDTVWLDAAATVKGQPTTLGTIGFRGVSEAVWNFHIGAYQVCEKWLKDRKGRTLSKDDLAHYQKIVVVLAETIRLMQEIDEIIDRHGGWPQAFQAGGSEGAEEQSLLKVAEPSATYSEGEGKGEA
jgi:hypothetical protein